MHFAAYADVNESVREPLRYYRNNVVHTIGLLELMRKHEIRRFVFSSTCATYGVPPSVPITEDMPQHPISPYGRTKLAMEWAIRDCARAWELGGTALRYFNASGASADATIGEDHTPETHLIPIVLQVALGQRESVSLFGVDYPTKDGTCVRDYIHVEDLADVHRIAIETQPPAKFRYYNVGTGAGVSVKEVVEACRSSTPIRARSSRISTGGPSSPTSAARWNQPGNGTRPTPTATPNPERAQQTKKAPAGAARQPGQCVVVPI
jgi:UDP-glucose-4-epimerase GalE